MGRSWHRGQIRGLEVLFQMSGVNRWKWPRIEENEWKLEIVNCGGPQILSLVLSSVEVGAVLVS